ncbi:putative ubiquitin/ribosomal protein S27a fusion protein, partial [Aduncisulcus paluster]
MILSIFFAVQAIFLFAFIPFVFSDTKSTLESLLDSYNFLKDIAEKGVPVDDFKSYYLGLNPTIERAPIGTIAGDIGVMLDYFVEQFKAYITTYSGEIQDELHILDEVTSFDNSSYAYPSSLPLPEDVRVPTAEKYSQFFGFNDDEFQLSYDNFSYYTPASYQSNIQSNIIKDYSLSKAVATTLGTDNSAMYDDFVILFRCMGFTRIIGMGGLELAWPAVYSAQSMDDASVSIEDRMTRDPREQQVIYNSNSFNMRRGVVVVIDTTIDDKLLALLSNTIGGDVFQESQISSASTSTTKSTTDEQITLTYESLVLSLMASLVDYIETLNDNTYLAIVDTSGEWRGHLFPESSTAAKTCYGQVTSTVRTGGLTKLTTDTKQSLQDNLKRYFWSLSSLDDHVITTSTTAAHAESSNPLFTATSLGIELLRSAVEPTVDIMTIIEEKNMTVSQASMTERNELTSTARPLAQGSPLSLVFMSLGSTPHPYFLIWLKHQLKTIPGAPVLPMWVYIDMQKAIYRGYGTFENGSSISSSSMSHLKRNISTIDSVLSDFRGMKGVVIRVDLPSSNEGAQDLYHSGYAEAYAEGVELCGDILYCDPDRAARSSLLSQSIEIKRTIGEMKDADISLCFQTYVDIICQMDDYSDVTDCRSNKDFITSIIPISFASSRDPVTGNSVFT